VGGTRVTDTMKIVQVLLVFETKGLKYKGKDDPEAEW
jgi:hypothetical protein